MSDAPVTVFERIAVAAGSKHLEHKETDCAIDKIGALGLAGVQNELSSAVFRLKYGNEPRFYEAALVVVTRLSKALAGKHQWTGPGIQFESMNRAALDYWINDKCAACLGRGYEKMVGAPVLSDVACPVCKGTARRPLPKLPEKWHQRMLALLAVLDECESRAGADVMAKLNRDMDGFKGVR
jgi:hypothetical protein